MKTNFTILLPVLLLSILLFNGCSKMESSCDKRTETITLNSDDKSKVPYLGNDTLIFTSNNNDTVKCIGSGKIAGQDCEDGGGNPDCPAFTKTLCYENNTISYRDTFRQMNISLGLYKEYYYLEKCYDFLVIKMANREYYFSIGQVSSPTAWNFIPSIIFNNKQYSDVSYAYRQLTDTSSKIFYSAKQGIIRIELNNKQQTWTLISK